MKLKVRITAALVLWTTAACALTPYQEGVRDYYSGICYRAHPYLLGPADKDAQWDKGFQAAKQRDHNRVDREACTPSAAARGIKQ
jgi:hypothetical protein